MVNLQRTDTYFEADCLRLATLMRQLGHAALDLLKLDIEGAEYAVLEDMRRSGIAPRVLCVEFDECNHPQDARFATRIRDAVRALGDLGYGLTALRDWNACFVRQPAAEGPGCARANGDPQPALNRGSAGS